MYESFGMVDVVNVGGWINDWVVGVFCDYG